MMRFPGTEFSVDLEIILTVDVPDDEIDLMIVHVDGLPFDSDADRSDVPIREHTVHESRHEARLTS